MGILQCFILTKTVFHVCLFGLHSVGIPETLKAVFIKRLRARGGMKIWVAQEGRIVEMITVREFWLVSQAHFFRWKWQGWRWEEEEEEEERQRRTLQAFELMSSPLLGIKWDRKLSETASIILPPSLMNRHPQIWLELSGTGFGSMCYLKVEKGGSG